MALMTVSWRRGCGPTSPPPAIVKEPSAGSRVHDVTLVADGIDDRAVRLVMGHALGHIEQFYIEGRPVAIDRLRKVTGRVRKWLYSK
jgi:hypothetical protein